ncbi:MAG TPA: hypothetical protein VFQ41_02635 [Candidatus Angelobacter sp.]|nr:hypothetical protein [Candidatus Angelobacter sp.]
MRIHLAVLRVIVFVVLARACSFAEAQKIVKRVVIHSSVGSLEAGLNTLLVIQRKRGKFLSKNTLGVIQPRGRKYLSNGQPVSAVQVQSLVAALSAAPLTKLDMTNLGITNEWLASNVQSQWPPAGYRAPEMTADQKKLFQKSFTNLNLVAENVWPAFMSIRTDYSAFCKVEIVFDDGSKLSAESYSYSPFMLPWSMKGRRFTYNADISRAVAALLPAESANKGELAGDELASDLAYKVMASIERERNLQERAGEALKMLRTAYEVITAELTPYSDPGYGINTYRGVPEEMNLHAAVRRSNFPSNLTDALVLRYAGKKVEGVDEFLKSAAKYEDLALSVPWLNDYIRGTPGVAVQISYAHDKSFGDNAMGVFTADMKLLGREDLIEQVKSQQADITLLIIDGTNTESYWLLFPDKHMVLWRHYAGAGILRLLKWAPKDFRRGERKCSDGRGFCSGREVTAEGMLTPSTRH